MKTPTLLTALIVAAAFPVASSAFTVDFESVPLGPSDFENGAGLTNTASGVQLLESSVIWTVDGVGFNNRYSTAFGSWSGWAVSATTDTTTPGFGNQYSSFPGGGANGSQQYGVAFTASSGDASYIQLNGLRPVSMALTNTTYTALDMMTGSFFSKAFGGESGDDEDFLLLTIEGLDEAEIVTGTVEFYLADYRFADNSLDYIVDEWTKVDLTPLGSPELISFQLTSSDTGFFGINTPAYFAMDNLVLIPEPSVSMLMGLGLLVVLRRRR